EAQDDENANDEISDDDIPTASTLPTDLALVATYLDPRFKHFNWATNNEKERAQNLVKTLYDKLKIKLTIPDDIEESFVDKDYEDNDDFFNELEANSIQTNSEEEDE
ncbi:3934_t:CDS:2, partial [Racocetra fulgida]